MLESQLEYPCETLDISPGGMQICASAKPQVGAKVVVYVDALGRFVGKAVRVDTDGFSMTIEASLKKREMLADKLTWFVNRVALNLSDERRHDRFEPFQKLAVMRLPDGSEYIVRIRDLSASGVSVEANCRPNVGSRVVIGKADVIVVRHFDCGFAAEFVTPFAPGQIDEATQL